MKSSGIEWIGDIPEEWEVIKLKYISCFYNGFSFDSNNLVTDYIYPVIRIGDIKGDDVNFNSSLGVKDDFGLSSYLIKDNDILLAMSGATVGKVGFVEKSIKSYINQRVGIIRTSLPHFVFYNLLTKNFMEYINIRAEGSAQPNISSKMIENFSIAYPKKDLIFEITNRIKNKIRIVNDTVKLINNQIENLENYKKSVITEAVTKGLDKNVEMKDSGIEWIGEIPKKSKLVKLKYLVNKNITDGTHQTPEYEDEEKGYPFLSSKDVTKGYIDWSDIKYITKNLHKKLQAETTVRRNDILLAKNGTTGIAAIVDTDKVFDIYVTLALIRPNTIIINPKFLMYSINSLNSKKQFDEYLVGIGVPNLHLNLIKNTYIVIHDLKIQAEIVNFLDNNCKLIDDSISLKRKQLETLEEYKKSLIYEYVTGKKEVTDGERI